MGGLAQFGFERGHRPVLAGRSEASAKRAAAAVDDPHIIPVFEAGEADGVLFLAMRYVPGGDVRTLVRRAVPLSPAQALAIILGDKSVVRREQKILDPALRAQLERFSNLQFPEASYTFFIAARDAKPERYAIQMNEIGKTEPITFMVGMSPEGKVTEVVIMIFRENRGWEVKEKRFLNQFRGKTVRSFISGQPSPVAMEGGADGR
jgi:serine/threonine protein kinase